MHVLPNRIIDKAFPLTEGQSSRKEIGPFGFFLSDDIRLVFVVLPSYKRKG